MRMQKLKKYNRVQDKIHNIKYMNGIKRSNITEYEKTELAKLIKISRALYKDLY
jgi:endonuclease III-like uncharacterized protein|tara:strand:- start:3922 stop:4083 length:162 start_codon:yes stop_codon:yes gene_type:complete